MEEWLEFDGEHHQVDANTVRVVAAQGGEIEVATEDVLIDGNVAKVRAHAKVRVTVPPSQPNAQATPDQAMIAAGDCDRTACIGLVEICCGSGRALRPCIGVWGCS
jgi:hypothetical protein